MASYEKKQAYAEMADSNDRLLAQAIPALDRSRLIESVDRELLPALEKFDLMHEETRHLQAIDSAYKNLQRKLQRYADFKYENGLR